MLSKIMNLIKILFFILLILKPEILSANEVLIVGSKTIKNTLLSKE